MTRKLAFFDRLTVFVAGVVLLVVGLIPVGVYFDIPLVTDTVGNMDRSWLAEITQADWYIWALIALAAVLILVGVSLLAVNLRSRSFTKREITEEFDPGTTTVHVAKMAQAIGNYLAQDDNIKKVDTSVAMVGERPTITFTVQADPDTELRPIITLLDSAEDDFRDAVEEMDMDTVYKLHLSRVEP